MSWKNLRVGAKKKSSIHPVWRDLNKWKQSAFIWEEKYENNKMWNAFI